MGSHLPIIMPLESSIAPKSRLNSLVASLVIPSRRQTTAPASTRREPSFAALGTIAAVASRQNMGRLLTRERQLWVDGTNPLAREGAQRHGRCIFIEVMRGSA